MKYLLIDGMNMLFRCFYGIPELSTQNGFPTNAIQGWIKSLGMLEDWAKKQCLDDETAQFILFFDMGGATRQTELYSDYKAQRKETPEALKQQIDLIKKITDHWGIPIIQQAGIEADDWIASVAYHVVKEGHHAIIVSSDKDFAQCLNTHITQLLPPPTANPKLGWRLLEAHTVKDKFGVEPSQIPAMLALMGDASDNIPGIPGAGPKTVTTWLNQYGTLDAVFEAKKTIKPARFQPLLEKLEPDIQRNLEMVTLKKDLPIPPIHHKPPNETILWQLLSDLEMHAALRDVKLRFALKSNTLILE